MEFLRRRELVTLQALASGILGRAEAALERHDLRAKVRRRPWLSAGLAACAGLLAVHALRPLVTIAFGAGAALAVRGPALLVRRAARLLARLRG